MKFRLLALILAFACLFTLASCQQKTPSSTDGSKPQSAVFPGTPGADTVVLDITSEPADLNPMMLSDGISVDILRHCMSGLARLDANDQAVPDLAKSWDISDDNTVYTVHLREDAKWSNGDPVTAHDFYYSWMTQMNPETGTIYASFLYANIKNGADFYNGKAKESDVGLEVLDDYTLRITWARPMPSAYLLTFTPFLPMNKKAYETIGAEQYAKDADNMVTNGPYQISEWVHDDHITLSKVEGHYNADLIGVPTVKLAMIGDANTRLNAFLGGELDLTNLYSEQIDEIKNQDENAVGSYIDGGSWYFCFNNQNEYLKNANLRKALSYAIDVQSLLDNVIKDGSVAANGLVPHVISGAGGTSYADARGSLFAYDADAAKAYFEKALGELNLTPADLKLELIANDSSYSQTQAAFLQQQWKEKLGLDVNIRVLAWKARVEAQSSGDFDMIVEGWGPSENDAITFLENYVTGADANTTLYSNAAYDELIAKAVAESDAGKRQDLLIQAEKMLIDDMVIGPLYFTCTTYAKSGKLEGLVRTPFQIFSLYGASIAAQG